MAIILQSTVGGFSAEFMRELPRVEQIMIAQGLDPSDFILAKDRAAAPTLPFIGPFFHDYTVSAGDESFTVTQPDDIAFLEFLIKRCIAPEQAPDLPEEARTPPGLLQRLFGWMAQPL